MNKINIFKRMFNNNEAGNNNHSGSNGINIQQSSDFDDVYDDLDSNYNYLE